MKSLLLLISSVCLLAGTVPAQEAVFSVKGFFPDWKKSMLRLYTDDSLYHEGVLELDMFSYNGKVAGVERAMLSVQRGKAVTYIPLFLEKGTIRVVVRDAYTAIAYGTPTNDEYANFKKQLNSLQGRGNQAAIRAGQREMAAVYIRAHTASPVSLQLLEDHFRRDAQASDSQYHALFSLLDTDLKMSVSGRKIGAEAAQRFATADGQPAIAMDIPDMYGKKQPLFKEGNFTLVSFWASWCLPCRKEYPEMLALWKRFEAKGFRVTRVSIDTDAGSWLRSLAGQEPGWLQLSDLQGWKGHAAQAYGVHELPSNFLIDAGGKMVGRDLTLAEMAIRLEEFLK